VVGASSSVGEPRALDRAGHVLHGVEGKADPPGVWPGRVRTCARGGDRLVAGTARDRKLGGWSPSRCPSSRQPGPTRTPPKRRAAHADAGPNPRTAPPRAAAPAPAAVTRVANTKPALSTLGSYVLWRLVAATDRRGRASSRAPVTFSSPLSPAARLGRDRALSCDLLRIAAEQATTRPPGRPRSPNPAAPKQKGLHLQPFYDGSDGTRTRDLRRDRPLRPRIGGCRPASRSCENAHRCRDFVGSARIGKPSGYRVRTRRSGVEVVSGATG